MLEAVGLAAAAQSGEQVGPEDHLPKALYLERRFMVMMVVMVIRTIITIQHQAAAVLPKRVGIMVLLMDEVVLADYFPTLRLMELHRRM
jgi:hypothetical protein